MSHTVLAARRAVKLHLLVLAFTATMAAPAGAAIKVNPATYQSSVYARLGAHFHDKTSTTSAGLTATESNKVTMATSTATEAIARMPAPGLTTSVSTAARGAANAMTEMTYYFQVVGPKVYPVPIIITLTGDLNGPSKGIGTAVAARTSMGIDVPVNYICPKGVTPIYDGAKVKCGSFSVVNKGVIISSTTAQPQAGGYIWLSSVSGSTTATLSTAIAIDPKFAHAKAYRIILSKGFDNP